MENETLFTTIRNSFARIDAVIWEILSFVESKYQSISVNPDVFERLFYDTHKQIVSNYNATSLFLADFLSFSHRLNDVLHRKKYSIFSLSPLEKYLQHSYDFGGSRKFEIDVLRNQSDIYVDSLIEKGKVLTEEQLQFHNYRKLLSSCYFLSNSFFPSITKVGEDSENDVFPDDFNMIDSNLLRLNWTGTPAEFGLIISTLIDKGYIEGLGSIKNTVVRLQKLFRVVSANGNEVAPRTLEDYFGRSKKPVTTIYSLKIPPTEARLPENS